MKLLASFLITVAVLHNAAALSSVDSPARRTLRALLDVAAAATIGVDKDNAGRHGGLSGASTGGLIVQPLGQASQQLRLCNAFAHRGSLAVSLARTHKDLVSLRYKDCSDLRLALQEGDQLDFSASGIKVGSFQVSGAQRSEQQLLLVVQRRRLDSMAAAFKSHAFREDTVGLAQVAVIDTFQGNTTLVNDGTEKVHIAELNHANTTRGEELPLNTVVAVNPGSYQVELDRAGRPPAMGVLSAKPQANYVVLRVGLGESQDPAAGPFPKELVVFPQVMEGSAQRAHSAIVGLTAVLALLRSFR